VLTQPRIAFALAARRDELTLRDLSRTRGRKSAGSPMQICCLAGHCLPETDCSGGVLLPIASGAATTQEGLAGTGFSARLPARQPGLICRSGRSLRVRSSRPMNNLIEPGGRAIHLPRLPVPARRVSSKSNLDQGNSQ
jgi:hypothetical protein